MRLRAEHVETTLELQDWARRLNRFGRYPCDPVRRFAIGVYQIHQATDWRSTGSEYESYAAAVIHIVAACEALDIPLEQSAGNLCITDIEFGGGSDKELLYHISALQAHVVYGTNSASINRKSRFESGAAANSASIILGTLMGRIPIYLRSQALYEAMEIMQGVL